MNRLSIKDQTRPIACPHCRNEINVGALLGSSKSMAKTRAARANAKLGGWPKGKKRGKRKPDEKITGGFVIQGNAPHVKIKRQELNASS